MSLSGSLQIASNSLRASQIGLQVVGQNIANANTPGYIREEVNYAPAPTQQLGGLLLGLGVEVNGIVQKVDTLLEQRLRNATSDVYSSQMQQQIFQQLETLAGELGEGGLGQSLSSFFASIHDVLNQPESVSIRNLTVQQGQRLAADINRLNGRTDEVRSDLDKQLASSVEDVNRLTQSIAKLNVQIANAEGGNTLKSAAVGLRDQRGLALTELSKLVDINVQEQPDGTVAIYTSGDFLVFGDETRQLKLSLTETGSQLRLVDNNGLFQISSGKLHGLLQAHDQIIGGFQDKLDHLANTLAFEFNKLHASGQGLRGYQQVTSQNGVEDIQRALDAAGLPNAPVNGSFQLQLFNRNTGLTKTTSILVDLNGLDHDTTLADLRDQIDAIEGVSASIDADGHLTLSSDSDNQEIAFGQDTSGVLAALGINTFFTGSSASSLGVNQELIRDASKFAASLGGVGADADNAVGLASFLDRPLDSQDGSSLSQLHDRITVETTQASAQARSVAQGLEVFANSLESQNLAVSGVNIDEEAIKLITLQRSFQAAAKFITTINELLGVLIDL